MSELVTGDAVVLGLRPARVPSRALAVLLDLVLAWTAYLLITLALLFGTASLDGAALAAVQVGLFLLVPVGVPIAVETLSRGRSVGKVASGLRVVREDGGPVRFRHALVRGAVGVVEIQLTLGVVACVASLVSARGRRLGDVFAGTLVVGERMPEGPGAWVPQPPPWVAQEFAGLDLSRVPEGLWLAIRQFLGRAGQLDPVVARSMAERLGSDLCGWTGTPAPRGMPAEVFLAGVTAERRAREERRFFPAPGGVPGSGPSTASGSPSAPGRGDAPPPGSASSVPAPGRLPASGAGSVPPDGASGPGSGGEDEPPRTGFVPPS